MKESTLSGKLAKRVRDRGGWCRKVHGGPYGAGWPDLIGCYRGLFLAIETKLPTTRNTVTDLQRATLDDLRKAGAVAVVISSVRQLDHVLNSIDVASTWPVTDFGPRVVLKRMGREARERREHRYAMDQWHERERRARSEC
jgi:hypothetical protein